MKQYRIAYMGTDPSGANGTDWVPVKMDNVDEVSAQSHIENLKRCQDAGVVSDLKVWSREVPPWKEESL